ncbi:M56 family metallopeptidase [Pontibacter sp. SGAir0037]|uniref:M56 family metallopeptidase n=1 Tax=Pontibacter sp. SGAir0037 TaxID=2571030 RepID=UPI0010CCDC06|nr:M56 family metallopeptidase [Pontibacter sp. SGAir0037]QCR23879.1 hypothetical protein C1N53_17015 [Pontibacter sp. SGAir0037]
MNFSTHLLPEPITSAIGWALLHSLWQAALVALVVALLMIALNRHSAHTRYKAAMAGMAVTFLLFLATFCHYYTSEAPATPVTSLHTQHSGITYTTATAPQAPASFWSSALVTGKGYFTQHLPLFVSLWLMGLLVMSLRFLGGLAYVQRLRQYKVQPLEERWQQTLLRIQAGVGVHQAVKLLESALVQVPMTFGYLKPVILLPVGAATGLDIKQLEAILAHELAHIKRHDYLLNLLQQIAETIFFFHPAVWWLSGQVRTEREHCCDDLAVAACNGDTFTYAHALTQLEELRMPASPGLALAFTGKKGTLLSRIKRLIMKKELRPSFGEGFAAALVIIGGMLLLSFGAWAGLKNQEQQDFNASLLPAQEKTADAALLPANSIPETSEALQASSFTLTDTTGQTSNLIIIKNKKGDIAELYVNGKRVPDKDIPEFQQLIEQQLTESKKAPRMAASEKESLKQVARNALPTDEAAAPVPPVASPPALPIPSVAKASKAETINTQRSVSYARVQNSDKQSTITGTGVAKASQSINGKITNISGWEANEVSYEKIVSELQREGLLDKDAKDYELTINQDAFYINGKKQTQQHYEKYKSLLLKDTTEGLDNYSITIKHSSKEN